MHNRKKYPFTLSPPLVGLLEPDYGKMLTKDKEFVPRLSCISAFFGEAWFRHEVPTKGWRLPAAPTR